MSEGHPDEIPPHQSPVRAMWAHGHGLPYRAFHDLEEARGHPGAVMVMEADYGGQILATCPVRLIAASPVVLNQLLGDLESITWGGGGLADEEPSEGTRIFYEDVSVGEGVAGGMGGGLVVEGVWVHDEIAELGIAGSVEDVLRGVSGRITLAAENRMRPFVSIPSAKQIAGARLLFAQIGNGWGSAFLSCDVDRINCGEEELAWLLHDLGQIVQGQPKQAARSRFFNIDVGQYKMVEGFARYYWYSFAMMALYVSPTGCGIHPVLRSSGPRPAIWISRGSGEWNLLGRVRDVLDGRSPQIGVNRSRV